MEQVGNEYSTIKKLADDFGFGLNKSNEELISQIVKKEISQKYLLSIAVGKSSAIREQIFEL